MAVAGGYSGSTGRGLNCQHCGAAFALPALTQWVQCPHCGNQQAVPAELLAELHRYQQQVAQHQAAAQQNYQHAAAWQRWTTGNASNPKKNFAMAYGLIVAPALVLGVGAAIVNGAGILPGFFRGPGLSFTIMAVSYGSVGVYLVWYFAGARKKQSQPRAQSENVSVACPNCGALGFLTPGDAVDTCGYCRAALVPSQTALLRAVDDAEVLARRAQIERHRQERRGMANVQGYNATNWLPYILGGSFLMPAGGGALVMSYQMLLGQEPFNPAIFILWAVVFGIVGGGVGFHHLRKQKRAAFAQAMSHVLRQFRGDLHDRVDAVVAWLNQFWPARYQTQFLMTGPYALVARVDARGFPALIYADPVSGGQHHSAKLHVLLAAWRREDRAADGVQANNQRARLKQMGFDISKTDAGLLAIADGPTLKRAARQPATLHELTPVLATLSYLAELWGMEPAQPIP
jgi:hypothetical protein